MNRNEENKYGIVDEINKPRSTWTRNFTHKTSFNAGKLVPFLIDMDIIPGTTIKNKTSVVVRMSTPLFPTMDNLYLDTYYFKCSKFWYWEHWRRMMGENDYGAWAQTIDYAEPKINTTSTYPTSVNDLATYYGVRMGTAGLSFSKIAVNAYIDIWNQWFRDQNLQAPIIFDKTDANLNADNTINTGFGLLPVQKFHDYFTSCLPEPQKGSAISAPLGVSAPVAVYGNGKALKITKNGSTSYDWAADVNSGGTSGSIWHSTTASTNNLPGFAPGTTRVDNLQKVGISTDSTYGNSGIIGVTDLTQATAASINALRLAFATQRILERDSMCGTRYVELLDAHFGSRPADESIMRPEYLGGKRIPINIETVLQNSSTDSTSPLGQTGAFSVTIDSNDDFTKSFTKDDILIGLICVRADHTYQQGLPRQLTRTRRLDRYWPELSHIGNQPVYNYEIYAQGSSVVDSNNQIIDDQVFGYKEAWQEYMYYTNRISGELLSDYATSLDTWHYGDDYTSLPVLADAWIKEPTTFIDRTLAVQSSTHNQFIADIYVDQIVTAPIPLHRVPGLIDHY